MLPIRRMLALVAVAILVPSSVRAAGTLLQNIKTSGDVVLAQWYGYRQYQDGPGDGAFTDTRTIAKKRHLPMLTVWSSPECHWCSDFADMLNTKQCQDYIASRNIIFAYFKSGDERNYRVNADKASKDAYEYIVEKGVPMEGRYSAAWPYFRFHWERADGTVVDQNGTFVIADQHISSFDEFKARLEGFLAGYDNSGTLSDGGDFSVSDSTGSRLVCEAGRATTVYVPLYRPESAKDAACVQELKWSAPLAGGGTTSGVASVAWSVGEDGKFISVPLPANLRSGGAVALVLDGETKLDHRESRIHVVEPEPVNQDNPWWIGERTADELGWGEWTMDLQCASQKVAAAVAKGDRARLAVLVGGELWCGDCMSARKYLFGTPEFETWARENHVALVLIDIPSKGTAPVSTTWDESGTGASAVSGAAYLSRHGIPPDAAAAVFARNAELSAKTLNPPYENRARPWVPTFFLIRPDGRIAGKLLGDRCFPRNSEYVPSKLGSSHLAHNVDFTIDHYILRLDELLRLADDPGECANNDWSTTTETVEANGGTWAGSLAALDGNTGDALHQKVIDVAELTGLPADVELSISLSGDKPANVRPSVIFTDGASSVLQRREGPVVGLSAAGTVWTLTNDVAGAARAFLSLEGADDAFFAYNRGADTFCAYELECSVAIYCGEERKTREVQVGTLGLHVEKDAVYLLSGVDFGFDRSLLDPLGGNLYRALASGIASLSFTSSGRLSYQRWRPGEVSFAKSSVSVSERDGKASLVLQRTNGSSGTAAVKVRRTGGTAASTAEDPQGGRYVWNGDVDVIWPEGVFTNQVVSFPVIDRSPRWDGDQTVEFTLESLPGTFARTVSPTNCTVTIREEDPKSVGWLYFRQDDPAFERRGLAYARAGEKVTFSIERLLGASSDVSVELQVTGDGQVAPAGHVWKGNSAESSCAFTLELDRSAVAGSYVVVRAVCNGIGMLDGVDRFTVAVIGDEAPGFAEAEKSVELGQNVACDPETAKIRISGSGYAGYEAVLVSGTLPPGIDARVEDECLVLRGSSGRIGTFESSWRVDGVCPDGSVVCGSTLALTIEIQPLADICESVKAADSDFPGVVPVQYYGFAANAQHGLVASFQLTTDVAGRSMLTVEGDGGRVNLTSDEWSGADAEKVFADLSGGALSAKLVWKERNGRCGFGGELLVPGAEGPYSVPMTLFPEQSVACHLDSGVYAVDFEPLDSGSKRLGHAFLSVKLGVSGSGRQAKATYAGMLPDGRSLSGSAALVGLDSDFAYLPIVKRTASGTFRALLSVSADAVAGITKRDVYNHSVSNVCDVFWDRSDGESIAMSAGGGYFRCDSGLEALCKESDYPLESLDAVPYRIDCAWDALESEYGVERLADAPDRYVSVVRDAVRLIAAGRDSSRITFSLSRATGVFSGRFLSACGLTGLQAVSYRGILLLNWGESCGGCGVGPRPGPFKPFGIGTAFVPGAYGGNGARIALEPIKVPDED